MGVTYALLAMVSFAANIIITRYALARLPVEAGFFIVLATNILFPSVLFAIEVTARAAPWAWDWRGAGMFALAGVIGTFLGRRMLFDTVRLLGPSRASVFHSTAPAFALVAAWLLADELLGLHELALMAIVWLGLWFTQPRAGSMRGTAAGVMPLSPANVRRGLIVGVLTVAGFGFGNVLRGLAMRGWDEAIFGTLLSALAALVCQVIATRDWQKIGALLRGADRNTVWMYTGCGVATSLGSIFVALSMNHMEIALAVLVVHTTPLVIFPVSVFILKNREELTPRTLVGAFLVLAGISLLAFR